MAKTMTQIKKAAINEEMKKVAYGERSYEEGTNNIIELDQNEAEAKRKGLAKKRAMDSINKERYVMQNMKALAPIYKELTHAEAGVYYKLFCELNFGKASLEVDKRQMTMTDMVDIVGIKRSTLFTHVSKLTEKGLIIKEGAAKGVKYIINPEYVVSGKLNDKKTAFNKVFQSPSKNFFDELSLIQLGFFIKLSMHIDMNTLIIAENPYEKDPERIEPLPLKSVIEVMGGTKRTVEKHVKALGDAGILYWLKIGRGGGGADIEGFFIHPQVVGRGGAGKEEFHKVIKHFRDINELKRIRSQYKKA